MTTTTAWQIVPAPKYSDMIEYDCKLCGHESLTRPVFLADPTGATIAAGARCAAIALYGDESTTAQRRVRNAYDAAQHAARQAEEMRLERVARYTAALAAFGTDRDFDPALRSARKAYHAVKPVGMSFPAFIAAVAATGEFPG